MRHVTHALIKFLENLTVKSATYRRYDVLNLASIIQKVKAPTELQQQMCRQMNCVYYYLMVSISSDFTTMHNAESVRQISINIKRPQHDNMITKHTCTTIC